LPSNPALRYLPALVPALLLGPVLAGLLGTLAPAFGILPVIGRTQPGWEAFGALLDWPGLASAVRLSLVTGLGSAVISLGIVTLLVACWSGTRSFAAFRRVLSPLLSVPHAAAAFGLAFLIAPSGLIVRGLSPWATGWTQPPDLLIVQDPMGLSLLAGLVAALGQADATRAETVARSLGHDRPAAWLKAVFPLVYRQIRLPVLVVLAFSMTVVDVAMILGPNTPPTLAVQILRWMSDPDLDMRLQGAAAATLQLVLVLAALALWWLGERLVAWLGRAWVWSGHRRAGGRVTAALALGLAGMAAAAVLAGLVVLGVWSVAGFWSFPEAWPDAVTWRTWVRHWPGVRDALAVTMAIAALATGLALALAMGCLEAEHRFGLRLRARGQWLLYLPLLVPQVAFLPGVQTWMLMLGVKGGLAAVVAAHVIFVFPYVFLSLGDPFRAWDARQATVAHSLGAGPGRVLWAVRLPMLLAPVLTAAAVGWAVSVGQYLPTLLIGGGRVSIGVWALVQTALALVPFALAIGLPRVLFRNRRGGLHG